MKRIILLLMLTVAALASVQSQAWASNAYVSPSERTVAVGDQFQLKAYINLNEEETASFEEMEREPSWWSSDNGVAVVDDDGVVRAVGVGTATIRATDDASDAPCVVTVVPRPMTDPIVILSSNTLYLYIDETYDESMYHYPEFSDHSSSELHVYSRTNEISVESVTWMSSNGDVASVHDGVVSAGRAGHTTITATVEIDGTVHELTCEVTVSDGYLHGVEIWQGDRCIAGGAGADVQMELVVGETAELRAESSSGEDISEFDWESSDESVATVVNGIVTAVGAGEAEITVIARGNFELFSEEANIMHCTVTVLPLHISAESISLDHSELSLTDGETATLTATVLPENATDKGVTWSSSDTSVATVDANGTVTAVAAGTATITATTTDGSELSASCAVIVSFVDVFTIDDLSYKVNEDRTTVSVIPYAGDGSYDGSVSVPASVTYKGRTYSVTSIGDSVFMNCSGLTSVTIPNSVTSIGGSAFSGCSGLTSVTIPNSVTSIGDRAFHDCSGLTSVTIGNSVTSIGELAFSGCSSLTSVTIPNSVTSIGNYAFRQCLGLTSVTIPNSVTSIGKRAFWGCSSLTSVTIGNSVASIDNMVFWDCRGLTSIKVEDGNVAYDSRNNCNALIETATNTLLLGCKNTTIPNSVTSIGDYAFYYCSGLTSVTIPNSVTSIGEWAFSGCSGLTSVTIPNSVTSIGYKAFTSCSGLTSVTIPNSVTSIGEATFAYCRGLTSVTIPNSVTSIGRDAFSNCSGLTDIYSDIDVPSNVTMGANVFNKVPTSTCVLHVPVGTTALYRTAAQWNVFTNIVEPAIVITSISLDHSELSLTEGETATLTATILPEDATDKGVTWSSSDTSVATVENGVVTAVAAGTATITATTTDGSELSASCAVTVSALQPANALAVAYYNCYAGDTFTVDVLMNNEDAIGGMQFDLYLPEGFSVALNKKGKPDITLDEDRIEDHQLMVNSNFADGHLNVLAFSLDNEPFYGTDGAVLHIGLVADADAAIGLHELEFRNIELSSPDGLQQYLADRLAGRIEVLPVLVESIALDRVSATLYDDESLTLTATVLPENATNRVVAWSSSDENVAVVDADGVVTPVSPGAAVITASTTDGTALSATCEVTILESVYELAVSDSECMAGETFEIQVEMNNTGAIGGVQFDLYLPEGFSVALNNKGKPDITLAEERTDGHQLMVNGNFADGHLNVLAFSMDNEAFVGNAGSVLLINVKAGEGVRGGIHELELRDIELSSPDGFQQHMIASLTAGIKVKVMGDANDDGLVTVSDVLIVARRANGYAVAGVDDTLIDINGDGRISVRDLLAVAKIANEASHAPSSGAPMRRAPMRVGSVLPGDNRLDITAIDRTPDGTFVLPVAVVNSSEIGGLQFDLHLPEGVSIARDNDGSARVWLDTERTAAHTLMLNDTSDDGHLHVMVFSADNSPLTGVDGTVVNVMLSVDPTIGGDAAVELRDIELASPNGDSYVRPADVSFALGVDGTLTGIDGIMNDADGDGLYYNLLGVPVQHPTPGIYIHNGKKVVVK